MAAAAAAALSADSSTNIPDYEYADVNTKPFHLGSFRNEWLNRLGPGDCSYQPEDEDEDAFDASFAKEMGIGAETATELRALCR